MSLIISLQIDTQEYAVLSVEGIETLSQPREFVIEALVVPDEDRSAWLGGAARIVMRDSHQRINRILSGIITALWDYPGKLCKLSLSSRLQLLSYHQHPRIFLKKTVVEIIREIFISYSFASWQLLFDCLNHYPTRELTVQLPEETDANFLERLLAKSGIFYWIADEENGEVIHIADHNNAYSCRDKKIHFIKPTRLTDQLGIYMLTATAKMDDWYLTAMSNMADLQAGDNITVDTTSFHPDYCGEYLIMSIKHYASQASGKENQGQEIPYYNEIKLIKATTRYFKTTSCEPQVPSIFRAKIISHNRHADLDEEGRYRARVLFDLNEATVPGLRRLTPYTHRSNVQGDTGIHVPIQDGCEVLVSCLNGDPDDLIILGVIPTIEKKSPVTTINHQQHILRTQGDNQLLMDDSEGASLIEFRTGLGRNRLTLDGNTEHAALTLASALGSINCDSKQEVVMRTEENTHEMVGHDRVHVSAQSYQLKTQQGKIRHQSAKAKSLTAKQHLTCRTGASLRLKSHQALSCSAGDDLTIKAETGDVSVKINQGSFYLKSQDAISITGSGRAPIEFCQANAGIRIDADGTIHVFGKMLNFISEDTLKVIGKIKISTI